jgi:5-hydroxyisourate hydrolase-like protein (transthyretin family)
VVDNNGQPISGVMVECCAINGKDWGGGPDTYTAADGTYSLTVAPGTYGLVFDMYGYDRVYYQQAHNPDDATLVQVTDGASLTGLDAMLTLQAVVINCWAFDVDDLPLAGIDVDVLNIHDQSVIASAVTGADGSATVDLGNVTDQTFKVRYTDPSGVYAIRFSGHSDTFAAAQGVYATHGCAGLSIEYLAYPQPGEIRGRTLTGTPCPISTWRRGTRPASRSQTTKRPATPTATTRCPTSGSRVAPVSRWSSGRAATSLIRIGRKPPTGTIVCSSKRASQ